MRQEALTLIIAFVVAAGCASHEPPASQDRPSGAEQARRDIEAGHLELRTYGFVASQDDAFARLLHERLGVQIVNVAGCAVGAAQLNEIEEYNRIMTAEIERQFGAGTVERVRNEAATLPATRPAA